MSPRNSDDDRDRDKLSWRERDALKNKSRHVPKDPVESRVGKNQRQRQESQARKALENFFKPKKNEAQEKAWKIVNAAKGREFERAAEGFVEAHGMPREWDDLLRLLDHEGAEFLAPVFLALAERASQQPPNALELALGKLSLLKVTHEDPRVLRAAEKLTGDLEALRQSPA